MNLSPFVTTAPIKSHTVEDVLGLIRRIDVAISELYDEFDCNTGDNDRELDAVFLVAKPWIEERVATLGPEVQIAPFDRVPTHAWEKFLARFVGEEAGAVLYAMNLHDRIDSDSLDGIGSIALRELEKRSGAPTT
jgi:hypothetical protein